MFKKAGYASMLAAAIGLPYAISNVNDVSEFARSLLAESSTSNAAPQGAHSSTTLTSYTPSAHDASQAVSAAQPSYSSPYPTLTFDAGQPLPTGAQQSPLPPLTGATVDQLGEVLRFDVTPAWVTARWARVTTTLADTHLDGLRVPLVSGTRDTDLTGSLTYYFDKQQQMQRLTFHGTTGNSARLVELLTTVYEFKQEPSLGGEAYTRRWNGKPTSVCRIRTAPVIRADMPNTKLEVLLEINRPGMTYGLSDAAKTLVEQEQKAKLW